MTARGSLRCLVAVLALAPLALACATTDHARVASARERYQRCVAASGESACRAEKERVLAAERAYEQNAQRAWGCDPAQGDCPTKR